MRPVQFVRIKIERFEINLGKHEKNNEDQWELICPYFWWNSGDYC